MEGIKVTPYGAWKSPITPDLVVSRTVTLMEISVVGEHVYWLEMRPEEQGRYVIVKQGITHAIRDFTPPPFNARTRVHEYGGAPYTVDKETLYFSNFADQRIYRQEPGGYPYAITQDADYRYADAVIDQTRDRLICVREDHTDKEREAVNTLVSIPLNRGNEHEVGVLVQGADFYSAPRLSPDGTQLAWVCWNHPNMPWDGCELWMAELNAEGMPYQARLVAGGRDESILQPRWSPDGLLYFISDRSGWWNLYRWQDRSAKCIIEKAAEFGTPPWTLGDSSYAFESPDRIVCSYKSEGFDHLATIETATGRLKDINIPYTTISYVQYAAGRVVFIGASPTEFASVVELGLDTRKLTVLRRSCDVNVSSAYLSVATAIEFPTENKLKAYAFFYQPKNRNDAGPANEHPPLLVLSHGGPTASSDSSLRLPIQYWTSRGFAVLDVNYGGSSGYGRAYRQRLHGQWGIVDVDDCINGACYLAQQRLVDKNRLTIRGGSAGGYTTLRALTVRDIFKAGATFAGLSDLEAFVKDTHKFESHYLDRLIGPYRECKDLYRQRSPIHAVDQLNCPVIFFQGLEDKIVPPDQAEKMVEALRAKKLPVAYVAFEGEQHGFRKAETIKRVLECELYFYSRVFGFDPADPIVPVKIENLYL